eukprot:jgi/Tetstr1/423536/TSEL_014209.t1
MGEMRRCWLAVAAAASHALLTTRTKPWLAPDADTEPSTNSPRPTLLGATGGEAWGQCRARASDVIC